METRWTQSRGDMLVTAQREVGKESQERVSRQTCTLPVHTHPGSPWTRGTSSSWCRARHTASALSSLPRRLPGSAHFPSGPLRRDMHSSDTGGTFHDTCPEGPSRHGATGRLWLDPQNPEHLKPAEWAGRGRQVPHPHCGIRPTRRDPGPQMRAARSKWCPPHTEPMASDKQVA